MKSYEHGAHDTASGRNAPGAAAFTPWALGPVLGLTRLIAHDLAYPLPTLPVSPPVRVSGIRVVA